MFPFDESVTNGEIARQWFKGQLKHADTKEIVHFRDVGEMLAIIHKWQHSQYKKVKKAGGESVGNSLLEQ